MEKSRDLRRANVSTVNDFPRRRQRITNLRDSTDLDRQMDLQETVRLGDRVQLQRKDREREFPKRRRADRSTVQQRSDGTECYRENESLDSSEEEYCAEEEETRMHRNRTNLPSPTSSTLSNNRRGLRTFRSSPILRTASDEMFGVPIPRRARSSSAKRLHEYCNLALAEEMGRRRFSPTPATVERGGSGSASPSSSGASMKKKMKSVDWRTPALCGASNSKPSVIQDDIEIEVAEALFDLMKQSHSQSQRPEKVDSDSKNTASAELKMLKAGGGKDENNAFSVQSEPSIKVNSETVLRDSVKEMKREGRIEKEREKFPDEPAQDLVKGDGFVNKEKVGSPKESESLSCVKVNACDIQDPTATKANNETIIAEAKRETNLELDLMAIPQLPRSSERDSLVVTDSEKTTQIVQKKGESDLKDGRMGLLDEKIKVINNSQLHMEKHRHEDIISIINSTTQQQQGRKELKNQSPTSLSFPISMSGWSGVLPHPGYMPPLQAILPINSNAKSPVVMQHPPFKFLRPRAKRCTTHQFVARNISHHQELVNKSPSSDSTCSAAMYGTKSPSFKYMLPPTQNIIAGHPMLGDFQGGQNLATLSTENVKGKISDAAVASDANATINGKSVLQQASHQAAPNFLRGPGFIFQFGHHQASMMAPANASGSPQASASAAGNASVPSNTAGRLAVNLPLPNASAAMGLNHSSYEAYMAMLQNSGGPIPISANIAMPPFKGGTAPLPFFNPSLYSSPLFNASQNQQQLTIPHASLHPASQTMNSTSHKHMHSQQQTVATGSQQSEKPPQLSHISSKSETEIGWRSGAPLAMIPSVSTGGGAGVVAIGNKNVDPPQQGYRGVPQAFGSSGSTTPALNFSSMAQNSSMFHMLPEMSWMGSQMAQQKNVQTSSDGKPVSGQSFNFSKSDCKEAMGPPKLDGLARSINFHPSSLNGNQQQLIQVQNSQMQILGTGQVKSSGFLTGIYPSNNPVFAIPNPNENASSQGQSFGGHHKIVMMGEPAMAGSSSSSLSKSTRGSTISAAVPPQDTEASPGGNNQKSSPACRRNVPPILSICPGQLSELKY